jgi:hypothetical protein
VSPSAQRVWKVEEADGRTTVYFSGNIDENTNFDQLDGRLKGEVTFHLGDLNRINSYGARTWMKFINNLPEVTNLELSYCPPVFLRSVAMLPGFAGPGRVVSFLSPCLCKSCGHETVGLLETAKHIPDPDRRELKNPPEVMCEKCGAQMEYDALLPEYFAALRNLPD